MNAVTATIDSKDQNRINIFMAAAYDINEGGDIGKSTFTARLAFWNMSIEAQTIACDMYEETFGTIWR